MLGGARRISIDGRYRLLGLLGRGGMGEVYLARDEVLDRDVAVKVLAEQYSHDGEAVERFRREAKSAAALSHPHIVPVYDLGETVDGTHYIVMEYVPGGTLKERILREGPLDAGTAARISLQVAAALGAAHDAGVIHRDVKPENILFAGSGEAKVTDFGIARAASSPRLTQTGFALGTADYMSPEQAMGDPVGPASDLYSLGVVLYQMLTGERPFEADSPLATAVKHVNEPPPKLRRPGEGDPAFPGGMDALVGKLLAKDPADRHGSASELMADLERVMDGLGLGPDEAAKPRGVSRGASG
ncbi:MAG: protein kinase, partial [Actinomycetota bacterium]|nr:protein kinase [Actinomycetota bacterium]